MNVLNPYTRSIAVLILLLFKPFTSFSQNNLWGLSASNANEDGVIFRTDSIGNNYTNVYFFSDSLNGLNPHSTLIRASDGLLYGLTQNGGLHNKGCIFSFDPISLVYQKVHDFDGINGQHPFGALAENQGKLFGVTHSGGNINRGVIFSFDPQQMIFTKLEDFTMTNGAHPFGNLLLVKNEFYGLASIGGTDGTGCIFQWDFSGGGSLNRIHSFIVGPSREGYNPRGNLIQGNNGLLYGFSRYGWPGFKNGGGVLFQYDLSGTIFNSFTMLHTFSDTGFAKIYGWELMGSPFQANNGHLYGMTVKGGIDSSGTIFEYNIASDTLRKIYDFNSSSDGFQPHGSLIEGFNGKLYGLTSSEGGRAKLFEFDINTNSMVVKSDLTGTPFFGSLLETKDWGIELRENPSKEEIQIYPNPAFNILKIKSLPLNSQLEIFNSGGQLILSKFDSNDIDISKLTKGVYFLKIKSNRQSRLFKFQKS